GTWTRVAVTVRTLGIPFSGDVGILAGPWQNFRQRIEVPARTEQRVFVPVFFSGPASAVRVRVLLPGRPAPLYDSVVRVSAKPIPAEAFFVLVDLELPEPIRNRFAETARTASAGAVAKEVVFCAARLAEFPDRPEYLVAYDAVLLSQSAQSQRKDTAAVDAALKLYAEQGGLLLCADAGGLPAGFEAATAKAMRAWPPQPFAGARALFDIEAWPKHLADRIVYVTLAFALALAAVLLVFVRTASSSSAPVRLRGALSSLIPVVVGIVGAMPAYFLQTSLPLQTNSVSAFCTYERGLGRLTTDSVFLIAAQRNCALSCGNSSPNWLVPVATGPDPAPMTVAFSLGLEQEFSRQNATAGDWILLAQRTREKTEAAGPIEFIKVFAPATQGDDFPAQFVSLAIKNKSQQPLDGMLVVEGRSAWPLQRVAAGEMVRLRDHAQPRTGIDNFIDGMRIRDGESAERARQLDHWRRAQKGPLRPALVFWPGLPSKNPPEWPLRGGFDSSERMSTMWVVSP
ncbi:MAG: hypothetical protein RDV41_14435, partial [Planctomycetota bacterium]|nr:hypothetical protein [Planctomycetota bacterium]